VVYATPPYINTLKLSTPIAEHVPVDLELRGCPINKHQLIEVITAILAGRKASLPTYSVCMECKRKGNVCVAVSAGSACLGPVTQAGCGALCPSYNRGCFGCFGPMESPNTASLTTQLRGAGETDEQIARAYKGFNAWAWQFRKASEECERK
jgi:sulfhydrogenase subunit delta